MGNSHYLKHLARMAKWEERARGVVRKPDAAHRAPHPPEYSAWRGAQDRCRHNPRYAGRGIRFSDEWTGPDGYAKFLAHIGPRPGDGYSLDRIDNDRGYEPGNVRWATASAQMRNTRDNVHVEWRGERKTVAEWAEQAGLRNDLLCARIMRGWSMERAMTTPPIAKEEQARSRGVWA